MQRQGLAQDLGRVEAVLQADNGRKRRRVLRHQPRDVGGIVGLDRDQHDPRLGKTGRVLREGQAFGRHLLVEPVKTRQPQTMLADLLCHAGTYQQRDIATVGGKHATHKAADRPRTRDNDGPPIAHFPKHQRMTDFCACSRFSASSKMTELGPSITELVTSSSRCAGKQCINSASGFALAISASFT